MKNKKKISPDKRAQVLGRRLVFESTSDYILSMGKDENYEKILSLNNQDGYITNDYITDFCSVFDMILLNTNIPSEIKKLLSKLSLLLASVSSSKNKIKIYDDITTIIKQIKSTITEKEYFFYARQIYINCYYSDYISPVFMSLDYIFFNEGLILGENDLKLIKKEFKAVYDNNYWPIPMCLSGSIDNINLSNPIQSDFLKIVAEYVQVATPKLKLQIKNNHTGEILSVVCAVARMYNKLSCRNKFLFDYNNEFSAANFQSYSVICYKISIDYRDLCSAFRNLLKVLDPKVFTRRKYIFKDTSFPDLKFQLETGENDILTFDNFSISEKHHKTDNEDFFMIYVSYSVNETKSTLPICINNFLATIGGFGETDFFVFFLVLTLYGIEDCIPESIRQTELQEIISIAKDNVESIIENRGVSKSSGYHQKKEVHVDAFIRKLPAGQKASDSAKELAKYYGVNLGDTNTIVSEYTKNKKTL